MPNEKTLTEKFEGHTPGPWRVRGKFEPDTDVVAADGFIVADTGGAHLHKDHDANQGHWATTPGSHRKLPQQEEEANARLVAAAPELLRERDEARQQRDVLADAVTALVRRADAARADKVKHIRLTTGDGGDAADLRAALAKAGRQ